ncbi:hypothetical protein AKJ60_01170 [candidate division MSBL1 archaeon SCGC-AAA385M11]|nr:hypothetical protein AKJ60_01170 [candidate division MSBL1 archaeon SCGC-AAA385M11]
MDTREASGEGLSWATEESSIEPRGDRQGGDTGQLLNYLILEVIEWPPIPWLAVSVQGITDLDLKKAL